MQTSSPSSKVSFKGALLDVKSICESGLSKVLLDYMDLVQSPLKPMFMMIRRIVLPEFENERPYTSRKIAYVSHPDVQTKMVEVYRLLAVNRDHPGAPPVRHVAPFHHFQHIDNHKNSVTCKSPDSVAIGDMLQLLDYDGQSDENV